MEAKLLVLKRVLEAFNIPAEMGGVDDRKLKQKAVYLCQIMGLDLGYRYGWYLMGPYSPSLARDYYALAEEVQDGADERQLNETTKQRLQPVLQLVSDAHRPAGLDKEGWFELLASWHYLRNVNKMDAAAARQTVQKEKPHLSGFIDAAVGRLGALGL